MKRMILKILFYQSRMYYLAFLKMNIKGYTDQLREYMYDHPMKRHNIRKKWNALGGDPDELEKIIEL